jgi:hypothetical protein
VAGGQLLDVAADLGEGDGDLAHRPGLRSQRFDEEERRVADGAAGGKR